MAIEKVPERLQEMVRAPDWYLPLKRYGRATMLGGAALGAVTGRGAREGARRSKRHLEAHFENLLNEGAITLGQPDQNLEDWDSDRQPIDTIVLHHTSRPPGLSLEALNALHLLRLYVPRYQSEAEPVLDKEGRRAPIYSGHFDKTGSQVFYGYHHFVRQNGTTEELLPDTAIGWHAGNWEVNQNSVAICIDDDLTDASPTSAAIAGTARLIHERYPQIPHEAIKGHNEIINTECPGPAFLKGWKLELLEKLEALKDS